MRESGPVLLVLSVFDAKLFLRKAKFYLRNVKEGRVIRRLDQHRGGERETLAIPRYTSL